MNSEQVGRRIVVVGTSGSGKTTLARQLAQKFGFPHVELDGLHWEANWTEASPEVFRERVAQAISRDSWSVDGNYSKVRDIIWARADTIIYLNYSLPVIMRRLLKRTLVRSFTRQDLWGTGNRESLRRAFFSRDSLLLWVWQNYRRRRKEYPILFSQPEYAHLKIIQLRSPRALKRWLVDLTASTSAGTQTA